MMKSDTQQGSPQFPTVTDSIMPSPLATMDATVQTAQARKEERIKVSREERIALLD
jgi:hypothetical protein